MANHLTQTLVDYLREIGGDAENGADDSNYDAMLHLAADELERLSLLEANE